MAHPEIGHRILMRLIKDLEDVAVAETMPRQEGNQMHTILTGKKGASKPKARAEAPEAEVKS
ncbi:translation initiation factor IF-3 [compost metagenome]